MVWIKICGITEIDDAKQTAAAGADALGFILSTDSPRRIGEEKLMSIISGLEKLSLSPVKSQVPLKPDLRQVEYKVTAVPSFVGVFVNEEPERIIGLINRNLIDFVQLSGVEDREYIEKIKGTKKSIKVIKLLRISSDTNRESVCRQMNKLKSCTDFFLLDTYSENALGGTGRTFEWHLVEKIGLDFPVILAGGLDSSNVDQALEIVKPFGVDASSGLESYPGRKDINKTRDFIEKVRSFEKALLR